LGVTKSARVAANPLIPLETAKDYIWNFLGKAWKSLDFPWKCLEILAKAWKNLAIFNPPLPAARRARRSERRLSPGKRLAPS
jgi:hypothetical protein